MKTIFRLETFDDLERATSPVRQEGDTMPILTGKLECCNHVGESVVHLKDDPHFTFSMPIHEFLNESVRRLNIPALQNTVGVVVSTNL